MEKHKDTFMTEEEINKLMDSLKENDEESEELDVTADEINEILSEMLGETSDFNDDDSLDENETAELDNLENEITKGVSTESGLDEEELSDEEVEKLLNEIISEEEHDEDELEEGMSVASQTHKTIGSKGALHTDAKPERRSGLSEEFSKLKELTEKLIKENKELKSENVKVKDINNKAVKRLDQLKNKLYEATVISHKTAYVNQLFLENTLTKEEKQTILKEFKDADTIEGTKIIFERFNSEISKKSIVSESIEQKITKTVAQTEASTLVERKLMNENQNPLIEKWQHLINYK